MGFPVGTWTEDRADSQSSWGDLYKFEGRSAVGCSVSSRTVVTGEFVAPAVSLERLVEGVTLADGASLRESGARIEGRAESVSPSDGDAADSWRSIPIRVTVTLPGYRPLVYDYLLDQPAVARTMEREEEVR